MGFFAGLIHAAVQIDDSRGLNFRQLDTEPTQTCTLIGSERNMAGRLRGLATLE